MFCKKCGKNNIDSAMFCEGCGNPLNKTEKAPVNNKAITPKAPKVKKPKDKRVAALEIVALILIALIAVLLLIFVVFRGKSVNNTKSADDSIKATKVVDEFIAVIDDNDEDDFIELYPKDFIKLAKKNESFKSCITNQLDTYSNYVGSGKIQAEIKEEKKIRSTKLEELEEVILKECENLYERYSDKEFEEFEIESAYFYEIRFDVKEDDDVPFKVAVYKADGKWNLHVLEYATNSNSSFNYKNI